MFSRNLILILFSLIIFKGFTQDTTYIKNWMAYRDSEEGKPTVQQKLRKSMKS